jgi:hypothetical protein
VFIGYDPRTEFMLAYLTSTLEASVLFAASGLVFLLFVTSSVAIILNARAGIRLRAAELNRASVSWNQAVTLGYGLIAPDEIETVDANSFSSSLVSAIKVHSDANHTSLRAEVSVDEVTPDSLEVIRNVSV